MVTAVQAAVVAAAAAWVIGVGVAVYVMLKAARLISETSTTVTGLRERGDLLIGRANAAIDRAGEQITRTEAVTASIEGVTATTADAAGRPLAWAAALVYGIRWAAGTRRAARPGTAPQARPRPSTRAGREAGRRAALTGRADRPSR